MFGRGLAGARWVRRGAAPGRPPLAFARVQGGVRVPPVAGAGGVRHFALRSPWDTNLKSHFEQHVPPKSETDDSDPFAEHPDNGKPFLGLRFVTEGTVWRVVAVAFCFGIGYGYYQLVMPLLFALQRYDVKMEEQFGFLYDKDRRDEEWARRKKKKREKQEAGDGEESPSPDAQLAAVLAAVESVSKAGGAAGGAGNDDYDDDAEEEWCGAVGAG